MTDEWEKVIDAFKEGKWIKGTVLEEVRGGYRVKIGEKLTGGFLPKSKAPADCVGMELPFKVIKLDLHQFFIISSLDYPKAESDKEVKGHDADWYRIIEAYKNKYTIQGTVTDVTARGLKVKIGSIEAFLPIDEIDMVPSMLRTTIGKTMEVKVMWLYFNREVAVSRSRVSA